MPQYSPGVFAGGALLALAAAFALGLLFRKGNWVEVPMGAAPLEAERVLIITALLGKKPALTEVRGFTGPVRQALRRALREEDWRIRYYQVRRLVQAVTLREIPQAAALAESWPESAPKDELLSALLEYWGEMDGTAALTYAFQKTALRQRETAVLAVLAGWARGDPEAAWRWARSNSSQNVNLGAAVFHELALASVEQAWRKAEELPEGALKTEAMADLCLYLFRQNGIQEAEKKIQEMPAGPARTGSLARLAAYRGHYQPEATAGWLAGWPPGAEQTEAAQNLTNVWAAREPQAALDWAAALPTGETRRQCLETGILHFLELRGTAAAAEWLNQLPPHPDFDHAVKQIAYRSMEDDPAAAMTWAVSIMDPAEQSEAVAVVGSQWLERDQPAARQFLLTHSELPLQARQYLLGVQAETAPEAEPPPKAAEEIPFEETYESEAWPEETTEAEEEYDTGETASPEEEETLALPLPEFPTPYP